MKLQCGFCVSWINISHLIYLVSEELFQTQIREMVIYYKVLIDLSVVFFIHALTIDIHECLLFSAKFVFS